MQKQSKNWPGVQYPLKLGGNQREVNDKVDLLMLW